MADAVGYTTMRSKLLCLFITWLCCLTTSNAAFVEFQNCLEDNIVKSQPKLLQFVPLNVSAVFDQESERHNLNVTVWGNVTGQATVQPYPPPDDPSWSDPNSTFGKIVDVSEENNKFTTLFARYSVLSYSPYNAKPAEFCAAVTHGECPLGPAFNVNRTDLATLPAFSVAHDMFSTYSFTSITAVLRIQSGDATGQYYSCVSASLTPDLRDTLKGLLRYLPLAILITVGLATIFAAVLSPWGSSDIFHWSSNFGRDEDLLRLVTPGFADCLQYIQFIVLTGSLTLQYPGFFQPAVSRVGWSSLMFNESIVTGGNGTNPVTDGIYQYGNTSDYGLDRMSRLIGMTNAKDMWVGMIVWLVVIVAAVAVLTQLGFAGRWIYRQITKEPTEDLRSKNWPFTAGNIIRIVLNYFVLPLTALSFFQLVIAGRGPNYAVALAAIVIVAVLAFASRLLFLFIRYRPRSVLFDDLLTVLTYGPLYNTYCDDAATFALVPIFVNFLRGIAIGAVQQSGVAQVVLLAVSEIILLLTLNAFRPYPSATSMNIYHTCFSIIRLITILLSIAFVPSLQVSDGSRGWIGYAILLIHACVLVFGFFLNAVQTLIEVIARLAGAGGHSDADGGAARGGLTKVFGMRQLSRRVARPKPQTRNSMASDAAMLQRADSGHNQLHMAKSRSRSISASSTMLLDAQGRNFNHLSQNLDGTSNSQSTPDAASTMSKRLTNRMSNASGGIVGLQKVGSKDPYFRQPRRNTMDQFNSTSPDRNNLRALAALNNEEDPGEGTSTPVRPGRDDFEDVKSEVGTARPRKDYAVREVDFYYGVRGPALSSGTRRLKTGPADPTGPVSSASGWFKNLIGGKTKEKHKGFEVVRSARAPPPGLFPSTPDSRGQQPEPYHDDPTSPISIRRDQRGSVASPPSQRESIYDDEAVSVEDIEIPRAPAQPPSLPLIDSVGGIELPSRIGSERSRKSKKRSAPVDEDIPAVPAIPRKSSRRTSSHDATKPSGSASRLTPIQGSPAVSRHGPTASGSNMMPFTQNSPSKATPNTNRYSTGAESAVSDYHHEHQENIQPASYTGRMRQSQSHIAADRPNSVGFVQQHRASDNIHYSPESPEGSAAEVLGRSR